MIYKFLFGILPIVLTCIPGYHLDKDIVIQAYDIYFPLIFLVSLGDNHSRTNGNFKKLKAIVRAWNLFVISAIFSIFIANLSDTPPNIGAYLKAFRLFYPSFMVYFFVRNVDKFKLNSFWYIFLISMCLCPIIGILGYIFQIKGFIAIQTTNFGGMELSRAGSFWQEAGIFGVLSSIFMLLGTILLLKIKYISKKYKVLAIIIFPLNTLALFYSSTRSGFVVFIVGLLYISLKYGRKHIIAYLFGVVFVVISSFYLYNNDKTGNFQFFIDRITQVAELSSGKGDVNEVSSTRTGQWQTTLSSFFSQDVCDLLFGYGYKNENRIMFTDNGYIYILVSTGLIGFIMFIRILFIFFKTINSKFYVKCKYILHTRVIFLSWLISMIFMDSLTYIPVLLLVFLFFILCELNMQKQALFVKEYGT